MVRLATDENFDNDIIWGLLRRRPDLDIVRVQDVGLAGAGDPEVLEWAAQEGRIILTHDKKTFVPYATPTGSSRTASTRRVCGHRDRTRRGRDH